MAKSTQVTKVTVETKIGKLRFRQTPNGAFIVRCKGFDRIRIRQDRDGGYLADAKGHPDVLWGRTPEKAYRQAVKQFWC